MAKFNYKQSSNRPERTKFNPSKFGSTWASIFWKGKPGLSPVGEAKQAIIGTLNIGGKEHDLTFSECNKVIETLIDAKEAAKVSVRLGTQQNQKAHVGFMEVVSEMYKK